MKLEIGSLRITTNDIRLKIGNWFTVIEHLEYTLLYILQSYNKFFLSYFKYLLTIEFVNI